MKMEMPDEDSEADDHIKCSRTNRPAQALYFIVVRRMDGLITL